MAPYGKWIKPIGDFFPTDAEGYVVNPCRRPSASFFSELVQLTQNTYQSVWGEQLHSIYLRGSLARGSYVDGVSDVDWVALVRQPGIRWESLETFDESRYQYFAEAIQRVLPNKPKVELMCSSLPSHQNLAKAYPQLAMQLATQSLLAWGKNIQPDLPRYRPDRSMCLHYRWLETDAWEMLRLLKKAKSGAVDHWQLSWRNFAKLLVRVGFEMCIERAQRYTADLYPAFITFVKYYPEQTDKMQAVFESFIDPSAHDPRQWVWLEDFVDWMIEESKRRLYQMA